MIVSRPSVAANDAPPIGERAARARSSGGEPGALGGHSINWSA